MVCLTQSTLRKKEPKWLSWRVILKTFFRGEPFFFLHNHVWRKKSSTSEKSCFPNRLSRTDVFQKNQNSPFVRGSPKIALLIKWEPNRTFFLFRNSSPLKGSTKMGLHGELSYGRPNGESHFGSLFFLSVQVPL